MEEEVSTENAAGSYLNNNLAGQIITADQPYLSMEENNRRKFYPGNLQDDLFAGDHQPGLLNKPLAVESLSKTDCRLKNFPLLKTSALETDYIPAAAIEVTSNAGFSIAGFNGSGTSIDPYTFTGFNFTGDQTHLKIANTTDHFLIEDNLFDGLMGNHSGIILENVTSGMIETNSFNNHYRAVTIDKSENVTLHNNTVANPFDYSYNWITDLGSQAIVITSTVNTLIDSNGLFNCSEYFIRVENAEMLTISNNTICNKENLAGITAISLDNVNNTEISNNTFSVLDNYRAVDFVNQSIFWSYHITWFFNYESISAAANSNEAALLITKSTNLTVETNTFLDLRTIKTLINVTQSLFSNNSVKNSVYAMVHVNCTNDIIRNNQFHPRDLDETYGVLTISAVQFLFSRNTTIENNCFYNGISQVYFSYSATQHGVFCHENIIVRNNIIKDPLVYGIAISRANNCLIVNNTMDNTYRGVWMARGVNVTIISNRFINSYSGFYFSYRYLLIEQHENIVIRDNIFRNLTTCGMILYHVNNSVILNNTIDDTVVGILYTSHSGLP